MINSVTLATCTSNLSAANFHDVEHCKIFFFVLQRAYFSRANSEKWIFSARMQDQIRFNIYLLPQNPEIARKGEKNDSNQHFLHFSPISQNVFCPIKKKKKIDRSKLKAFADDKTKVLTMMNFIFDRLENTMFSKAVLS